jgi:transposase
MAPAIPQSDVWELIRVTLPAVELRPSGGQPWIAPRRIVDGVLFVLRTGCQWKAVPREFGSGSTVHRRVFALRASPPSARRVYQPAASP